MLGPPGTAKSALVQQLARRIDGRMFDYLLTRFTEPNEIFGPFDIRKLREGELETNTEGMLPEADFVFLDELLNANSAILNSLLLVLNERVFRRGRETRQLPTLMVVGASNHLPEDDALQALIDRFLVRVGCYNVADEDLPQVMAAGWALEGAAPLPAAKIHVDDLRRLQAVVKHVDLTGVRPKYAELLRRTTTRRLGDFRPPGREAAKPDRGECDPVRPTDRELNRHVGVKVRVELRGGAGHSRLIGQTSA